MDGNDRFCETMGRSIPNQVGQWAPMLIEKGQTNNVVINEGPSPWEERKLVGMNGISDDDFFHLTSHIDPTLKKKIENESMSI